MAGEEQYYAPIIQALMHSQSVIQEKNNLAEKTRASKQEEALRQHQIDIAETENNRNHDLALQHLDLLRMQHEAGLKAQKIAQSLQIGEALKTRTLRAPTQEQTAPGIFGGTQQVDVPQKFNVPGYGEVDPSIYSNPEEVGKRNIAQAAAQAGAVTTATEGAKQPFIAANKAQDISGRIQEIGATGSEARKTAAMNIEGRQSVADANNDTKQALGLITAQTHLLAAGTKGANTDPETIQDYVHRRYFVGDLKETQIPATLRPLITKAAADQGLGRALDEKDIQGIKATNMLDPVLERMQEFVDMLPKGKLAQGKALYNKAVTSTPLSTDLKTKYDIINSDLQRVATGLEGFTGVRPLSQAYKAESQSIPNTADTNENGQKKLDKLIELRNATRVESFKGLSPVQVKQLKEDYGVKDTHSAADPAFLKLAPSVNKSGHKLNREKSIELGQAVYN